MEDNSLERTPHSKLLMICEKIEALTQNTSLAQPGEELAGLKASWQQAISLAGADDEAGVIENRYRAAVEKAEAFILATKKENKDSSTPEEERLIKIIESIDEIANSTELAESERLFHQLTKEWESIASKPERVIESTAKRYWEACEKFRKNKDWILWANLRKKEEILSRLTALEAGKEDQDLVERFSEQRALWKETGPIPIHKIKETNKSYRTLCEAIYEKCLVVYEAKEQEKEKNLRLKEALCEEVESLIEPANWKQATEFVQKIQQNWQAYGTVPKEQSDAIWERFRAACAAFFEKRKQFYHDRKLILKENQKKKKELCEKIETIADSTDWKETSRLIRQMQKEWQAIGPSSRPQEEALWKRFRAACDKFFNAQKAYFESLDNERPANLEKKLDLIKRVEELGDMPEGEKYKKIIEIQSEWKEIGPVPKENEDEIWKRFRKPIDEFFEKRKMKSEEEKKTRDENRIAKETLCEEAERICNSKAWSETADAIKDLQRKWKQIGLTNRETENALWQRFHAACETFFLRLKEWNSKKQEELDILLSKKLDLCFQAEIVSEVSVTKQEEDERAEWQLKKLAENFFFRVLEEGDTGWESKSQKLKDLQKEWKEIGPIPSDKDRILWKRFQHACNFFFNSKKTKD